jgi:Flp pilus assembly protein TadD
MTRLPRHALACALLGLAAAGCARPGPFAEAVPPAPPAAEDLIAEGTLLLRAGDPQGAYRHFIRAINTGERRAQALTGAGLALEAQGMLTRAREYLERARDLAPGAAVTHNNLGVVLYRLGEYREARRAFRTAFAVSSGQNGVARANLELAEREIAARRMPEATPVTLRVQRLGSSEYRLLGPAPAPGDDAPLPAAP